MSTSILVILAIIVIAVIGFAAWVYSQKRRSQELRAHFGPEYDRAVQQYGEQRTAESALAEREKRVEGLDIRPLSAADRERFTAEWRSIQAQFVDDPAAAAAKADRIIHEVMQARGYPVGDFEQRAADISVEHPRVVSSYRSAHSVALRADQGQATTEELRTALVEYRTLFEDLLETGQPQQTEARR